MAASGQSLSSDLLHSIASVVLVRETLKKLFEMPRKKIKGGKKSA